MSDLRERLQEKTRKELFASAKELGISVTPSTTNADMINKILSQQAHRIEETLVHVAETPKEAVYHTTKEDVLNAIKHITDAKEKFEAIFYNDNTWHFKFNGAEESGNLSIPLRVIVMKANNVAKGRKAMMSLGSDKTYKGHNDIIMSA